MARGPKLHLKRLNASSRLMLSKLGGIYAPRPRPGTHKARESMPLILIIRNRLKYALNYREALMICRTRNVKVDNAVRTDIKFPVGFMDVVSIEKTKEKFRVLYDSKGRFALTKITKPSEANLKLARVKKMHWAARRMPFIQLHDGRIVKFPDPRIKPGDTVIYDVEAKKMTDWIKFKPGVLATVTGGANTGRTGEVITISKHHGSFDIVQMQDSTGAKFVTRSANVFVVGQNASSPTLTLHKSNGVRVSLLEDRAAKMKKTMKKRKNKKSKSKK